MNLEQEMSVAIKLAKTAGDEIMRIYNDGFETQIKNDGTEVTVADHRANEIILDGLAKAFPDDGVVSEELARVETRSGRFWYVDPIDGTSGFVRRRGDFAVHIGLAVALRPVLGVVYQPTTHDIFSAMQGSGAYHERVNGARSRIRVAGERPRSVAILGHDAASNATYQRAIAILDLAGVVSSGSEGLRIVSVARGDADVHFLLEHHAGTWDTAAPQVILEEAGGAMGFLDGTLLEYYGQRSWNGISLIAARSHDLLRRTAERLSVYL